MPHIKSKTCQKWGIRSQGVIFGAATKDRSEFHSSCTTNTMLPIINTTMFTKCLQSLASQGNGELSNTELVKV